MRATVGGWAAMVVVAALGLGPPAWANPEHEDGWGGRDGDHHTLFVDDDRQQCPDAQFTSIQAAVLAAPPGGQIHVCPGLYPESVVVDHTLRLDGAGPAPALRSGDPSKEAVVQTTGWGFTIDADDVDLSGFTVLGDGSTTEGVNVRPFGTGNSVERNFISGHAVGVILSVGGPNRRPSSISQNRIEDSRFGIAADDNLGPAPDIFDALLTIKLNDVTRTMQGLSLTFLRGVLASQNTITDFSVGVRVFECTEVALSLNHLETGGFSQVGITFVGDENDSAFGNEIHGRFSGPSVAGIFLDGSTGDLVFGNQIERMLGDGVLLGGAHSNTVTLNRCDTNGNDGIELQASSGNTLLLDTMHDNHVFDAADDDRPANVWKHDRCDTDNPPGTICTH